MDVVILAGGRPAPDDPLYAYSAGRPKACIDLNGHTMLEWLVDAVQAATVTEDVVVVGLEETDVGDMRFARPVSFLPDHGSLVGNARAGVAWSVQNRPDSDMVLLCSVDIPLLTGEMIDQHIAACRPFGHLAYYTFVTREVMEKRFPHSNRTFVRLRDAEVAGGDVVLVHKRVLETNDELWAALTNARKHAWKLARLIGWRFLLKFLLRRVGVEEIKGVARRMLNEEVEILFSPTAELAMDADKPDQVELMRQELANKALASNRETASAKGEV